jgi:hypothetical protein
MANDILLDNEDDLLFNSNGELVIGDSTLQDVGIIVRLNQGDLKEDPLLGPNLIHLINSNADADMVKQRIKLHLERDGKNYNELENLINLNVGE